jgi:hypothetical protein
MQFKNLSSVAFFPNFFPHFFPQLTDKTRWHLRSVHDHRADLAAMKKRLSPLTKYKHDLVGTYSCTRLVFFKQRRLRFSKATYLKPILRLLNLKLHRQRCSRLERFTSKKYDFYSKNATFY